MTTPTAVAAKPDPMPAAMLGMWLFLAGEAMFFAGLMSAFIVLQSSPEQRALFARSAHVTSLPLTIVSAALLVASAVWIWRRFNAAAVIGLGVAFLLVQALAGGRLLTHRTIVLPPYVLDGRLTGRSSLDGLRAPLPPTLDLARTMPGDLAGSVGGRFDYYGGADVRADVGYGPSRNNYFACYFLVTAVHALHVVGGLAAAAWLGWRVRRRTATDLQVRAVSLYWQFVNGVGLLSLFALAAG